MKCIIVGGADINNYELINSYLNADDFAIFCDCGLKHLNKLKINANLIVGDFDSYKRPEIDTETIVLPCEKDDTDTFFAVKEALKRGYDDFIIIGVIGNRFDHSLGNISILDFLNNKGKNAIIIDDYSEMSIISDKTAKISENYPYFSLLNIYGKVRGITIKNAKYPLKNAEITTEYQYAISNEVLKGQEAEVTVNDGKLLLIKIKQAM